MVSFGILTVVSVWLPFKSAYFLNIIFICVVSFGICIVDQYNCEVTFGILADRYTCICLVTCVNLLMYLSGYTFGVCVVTCGVFVDVFEWLNL